MFGIIKTTMKKYNKISMTAAAYCNSGFYGKLYIGICIAVIIIFYWLTSNFSQIFVFSKSWIVFSFCEDNSSIFPYSPFCRAVNTHHFVFWAWKRHKGLSDFKYRLENIWLFSSPLILISFGFKCFNEEFF